MHHTYRKLPNLHATQSAPTSPQKMSSTLSKSAFKLRNVEVRFSFSPYLLQPLSIILTLYYTVLHYQFAAHLWSLELI